MSCALAQVGLSAAAVDDIELPGLDHLPEFAQPPAAAAAAAAAAGLPGASDKDTRLLVVNEPRLDDRVKRVLLAKGIERFTDVQRQAFDPVFDGRDMIARSRTGTGKTLAFGLPIVERIAADAAAGLFELKPRRSPRMVIMAPTRELARQVHDELALVARPHRLSTAVFHGGAAYGPQEGALRSGIDILVATPGRITDHLQRGGLSLKEVGFVGGAFFS